MPFAKCSAAEIVRPGVTRTKQIAIASAYTIGKERSVSSAGRRSGVSFRPGDRLTTAPTVRGDNREGRELKSVAAETQRRRARLLRGTARATTHSLAKMSITKKKRNAASMYDVASGLLCVFAPPWQAFQFSAFSLTRVLPAKLPSGNLSRGYSKSQDGRLPVLASPGERFVVHYPRRPPPASRGNRPWSDESCSSR